MKHRQLSDAVGSVGDLDGFEALTSENACG